MGIRKYLKHKVDVVYVTMTKGVRSETIVLDEPAFVSQRTIVLQDELGDHFGTKHVIFLRGDITLNEIDELVVNDKQRPIISIFKVRTTSDAIHHLEVETQ